MNDANLVAPRRGSVKPPGLARERVKWGIVRTCLSLRVLLTPYVIMYRSIKEFLVAVFG